MPDPLEGAGLAVDVQDVSKRYGRRWALAHVSLQLRPGDSLLLTGHNGSGKTTLLKVLSTTIAPSLGAVKVFGSDAKVDREAIRRRVALLSHANYLYEDLSAEQNLRLLARLLGDDAQAQVPTLLDKVGLKARAAHAVREFSAGMRKRLAVARLLLKRPQLALLDEPFGELDPAGIAQMEGIIRDLKTGGTTLVLATHLVEQGQALCSRRLHLSEGRVAQQ